MRDQKHPGIELYQQDRYITVTGRHLEGAPTAIAERDQELAELYFIMWPELAPDKPASPFTRTAHGDDSSNFTDDELLEKARRSKNGDRFTALFDQGDISAYPSHSEADMALMNYLAFWLGKDANRMEQMFSRSALGGRDKWAKAEYRKRTIDLAIADCKSVYEPPVVLKIGGKSAEGEPEKGAGKKREPSRLDRRLAKRPCTDLGNGERFAARFGADARFCVPWKKWLHYDGKRWKGDDTAAVRQMAKHAVRGIWMEASTLEDTDKRKLHSKWWFDSEGQARVEAMLSRASSEPGIPVLPDQMDCDQFLLNVQNGTIDLKTGKLREHRRGDLITRLAPVDYAKGAKCPTWLKVLETIFAGDNELIQFWQRVCGICLTGDVSTQMLPVLYGAGANGKSTILGVLLEILGPDYAIAAPPGLLTVKKGERHPTELAALFGKRLVVDSETAEGARFNETLVKQLTGGDKISARRMKEDFWTFNPTHKLLLCTNHKPTIGETKNAIWRRVKLIPFNVAIPEAEQDSKMPERLRLEYPGILAWCVEGCLDWLELGLDIPSSVADATRQYRDEQDVLAEFLASECTVMQGVYVRASALYCALSKLGRRGLIDATDVRKVAG